jgi:hypothetical protein
VVILQRQKGHANNEVLKTLIQIIAHRKVKFPGEGGGGGGIIMREPNLGVAGLFPSRSTDADFRRFGPSVPNLKVLLLGSHYKL